MQLVQFFTVFARYWLREQTKPLCGLAERILLMRVTGLSVDKACQPFLGALMIPVSICRMSKLLLFLSVVAVAASFI